MVPLFTSAAFKLFVNKLGVIRLGVIPTDAHHSNGGAEAGIKKIVNFVKFYLSDTGEMWDEILPYAVNTINKLKQYHGKSALELMYGVKATAPGRIFESRESEEKEAEPDFEEYRQSMREQAVDKKKRCQARNNKATNTIQTGKRNRSRLAKKYWSILTRGQSSTVKMADPRSSKSLRRVHVEYMKPFIARIQV